MAKLIDFNLKTSGQPHLDNISPESSYKLENNGIIAVKFCRKLENTKVFL